MLDAVFGFLGTSAEEVLGGAVLWLVQLLISALPLSPFLGVTLDGLPSEAIGWLNWFVGIGRMVDLMGAWLFCVLAFMVLSKVLDVLRSVGGVKAAIGHFVSGLFG